MNFARRDDGVAMLVTLMWAFSLLVIALVVGQAVINLTRPSDEAERSFKAWAAAETGVEDLRARLIATANGDITSAITASSNPAMRGWVPIPGGSSDNVSFTYDVQAASAASAGRIIVTSTGKVGDQKRTVEAQLQKRQMFDYAYASMYETISPTYPDYWSGSGQYLSRAQADTYCKDRYWYASGATPSGAAAPNHRQSTACLYGETTNFAIDGFYSFKGGPVHTNDVMLLSTDSSNLPSGWSPSTVFERGLTSACPDSVTGVQVGCPSNHRWIASNVIGGTNNYVIDETTGPGVANWTPGYESKLEIRHEGLVALKARALEAGCVFTGPTRLKFVSDGTLVVTSPDTKDPDPPGATRNVSVNCGGSSLMGDGSTVAAATTPRGVALSGTDRSSGFNGVIYVQNVPTIADDPVNGWSTTPPSCADKNSGTSGVQPFPYVVMSSSTGGYTDDFTAQAGLRGFPGPAVNYSGNQRETFSTDEDATNSTANATTASCRKGTVYLEGSYTGSKLVSGTYTGGWTIVTEWDIALTSDITDASLASNKKATRTNSSYTVPSPLPSDWGVPPTTSTTVMGLVPDRLLYVYGCSSEKGCGDFNRTARVGHLVINASTVITHGCLTVMDISPTEGSFGPLTFVGSLGQMYRCPIEKPTGNGGFSGLNVVYDSRFSFLTPPPYISELSNEPWRIMKIEEINAHINR